MVSKDVPHAVAIEVKFFCISHANATVKVDRQSDFTCNHLGLSASWESSTKVDGKAHLLCNLTHAANVQHEHFCCKFL